jgi:hypothetical protein
MQQKTSKQLYAYWDRVRNGRLAPRRFEIEPARIAPLLPETFIAECEGLFSCQFRLAGTKICEQFGRELRGADLLGLFEPKDRQAISSLLRHVISDAAAGHVLFNAYSDANRQARFELVVMPLIHAGTAVNRLLGAISAIEPPFWLGSAPLVCLELSDMHLIWPDGDPRPAKAPSGRTRSAAEPASLARKRFRVYEGGAD